MASPARPTCDVKTDLLDGAVWHKSSCSGTHGNCVEVATNLPGKVAVRDSKDPDGPRLIISPEEWRSVVDGIRAGRFKP
jgi:hypothetical protein